jgi:hypothetical protein
VDSRSIGHLPKFNGIEKGGTIIVEETVPFRELRKPGSGPAQAPLFS